MEMTKGARSFRHARKDSSRALRIVSLAPSATSILLELGAGDELVGVSKWCKDVAEAGNRPEVGDCWKLDVEEVLRLKPSLLIGSVPFDPPTVMKILEQPVSFLAMNPRSLADIESDIRILGRITGRTSHASRLIARMRREFGAVKSHADKKFLATKQRPRVYSEAWPNPRISSPPWVAELISMAGGEMVVKPGCRVSDAEVAEALPDVIVLAWAATGNRSKPGQILNSRAFSEVPAVKNGCVIAIRDELLNTPGPPLVRGARELLRVLHMNHRAARRIRGVAC
jgi:iron complex transport system substrate-binding protein